MPLRAFLDNKEIISIDLTEKQWNDLTKRKDEVSSLKLSCCKQNGILKNSKGIKYFAHVKDSTCNWKKETIEQLQAKIEIIKVCRENNWSVIPEFSTESLMADILAVRSEKKIAFEIEWNRQTFEKIKEQQEKFLESRIRGCWFLKAIPRELKDYNNAVKATNDIPAYKISREAALNIFAQLNQHKLLLREFVDDLLNKKIKFNNVLRLIPQQKITIIFFEMRCWKCGAEQHCYTVDRNLLTICKQNFRVAGSMWDGDDIDKNPQVYNAVKSFLNTEKGEKIKIGVLKDRHSKTISENYLSHGCFYCDALFGDFPMLTQKMYASEDVNSIKYEVDLNLGDYRYSEHHWCYSKDGIFCE